MSPTGFGTTSTDADFPLRRARMVDRQLRRRGIRDERVLRAMADGAARAIRAGADDCDRAYRDGALAIGEGQTISQPWIVARMAELLELEGPERVLEVGTGSGYGAAVLSQLCSHVVTVERLPALAAAAAEALRPLGIRNVEVRNGDGSPGVPDRAPFDAICVTAPPPAASRPRRCVDQLVPGAPLVCPLRARRRRAAGAHARRHAWRRRRGALRAAGRGRGVKREFSAGGVVLRVRGRREVAVRRAPQGGAGAAQGPPRPGRDAGAGRHPRGARGDRAGGRADGQARRGALLVHAARASGCSRP